MYDIVSLTRCYERVESLERALQQSVIDMPKEGISVMNVLILDRLTPEVRAIVDKYSGYDNVLVSEEVEGTDPNSFVRNRAALNRGLRAFDASGTQAKWVWLHDDDQILDSRYKEHLRAYLDMPGILALELVSLFVWNEDEDNPLVNLNQHNRSPQISRYLKGHRWPEDERQIHCTKQVQTKILRNPYRGKTLPFYIIDYGATNAEFREKMARVQIKDFRSTQYNRAWTEKPTLARLCDVIRELTPIELTTKQLKARGMFK